MGLAGGLAGVLSMGALGVSLLQEPPEAGRWPGALALGMASPYLAAAWASLGDTPWRRPVQRGVTALSVAMVLAGLPLFGPAIALLLAVPTTLLAIAGGLIFRR